MQHEEVEEGRMLATSTATALAQCLACDACFTSHARSMLLGYVSEEVLWRRRQLLWWQHWRALTRPRLS